MTENLRDSFTAADNIPVKLLTNRAVREAIDKRSFLPPIHAQFVPTNRCNQNCDYCSCSDRDKQLEMSVRDAMQIISHLAEMGCEAVTITGGGEPLMHKGLPEIIEMFKLNKIRVGLVTNGRLLGSLDRRTLSALSWCRISNDDSRHFPDMYAASLLKVIDSNCDWAFSHVVSQNPDMESIAKLVLFANDNGFTHVRLVADLYHPKDVDVEAVRVELKRRNIDDSKVIFQGRKNPVRGGECFIWKVKPLIAADCKVYACCGVQYAIEGSSRDMPKELCLGSAFNMSEIWSRRYSLDGSICDKCYYSNYNRILEAAVGSHCMKLEHREFL